MSSERNLAIVSRFIDEYQTGGDDRVFAETMHPDFVDRSLPPGIAAGPDGVRQQFDGFRAALAGFRATIVHMAAADDIVMTHKVVRGTHIGEFLGVPATGRDIEIAVMDVVRLADGRIIEHWNVVDLFGVLAQLGALPVPAAA